jgi:hypothetical protein
VLCRLPIAQPLKWLQSLISEMLLLISELQLLLLVLSSSSNRINHIITMT